MVETIVSFELAKLAKEKGFDWGCSYIYMSHSYDKEHFKPFIKHQYDIDTPINHLTPINNSSLPYSGVHIFNKAISAPTQSLLQKWARENHGYHIVMIPTVTCDWTFKIVNVLKKDTMEIPPYKDVSGQDFSTYEEALEEGLQETLNLIKTK